VSTYRLQLHPMGFDGARRLVPYLDDLGVEIVYVSPVLAAAPGSTHGYDVVDPTRIDPALGGGDGLEALLDELHRHGMRLLVDVVPNHLAAVADNPWWWDVLRLGRGSRYAGHFDVEWGSRVLLPVLGRPLDDVLAAGELAVGRSPTGEPVVTYFDHRFPIDPATPDRLVAAAESSGAAGDDLAALVDRQHYRLAYWRLGATEGNYRRFFDVDGLVGVRVEDPAVYDDTHRLLLEVAADPRVAGVRVDHVDGLADPAGYLRRLRTDLPAGSMLVVEKILARDEDLPRSWPVDGTTGYELADLVDGLLTDGSGVEALAGVRSFEVLAAAAKARALAGPFQGQLARLAAVAAAAGPEGADLAEADLARALAALTVALPVYRTYLDGGPPSAADRRRLAAAVAGARLSDVEGRRALAAVVDHLVSADPSWLPVARRWQQLTGAVAAKGVEDTALYRFDGLLAAAEVGGHPAHPAVSVDRFHRSMARRPRGGLNGTSTHDSKRSEDVRARLSVLSELPDRWGSTVDRWNRRYQGWVAAHRTAPARHHRDLLYQSIVGTWPLAGPGGRVPLAGPVGRDYTGRLAEYAVKAAREGKQRTSWVDPDPRYERALTGFVRHLLGDDRFRADVDRLVAAVGPAGATNALATVVLRCTVPGVPDTYQGTELWEQTLVDPDNRRPVDFDARRRVLAELPTVNGIEPAEAAALLRRWRDGAVKLHVVRQLLHLRRDRPGVFAGGPYRAVGVTGPAADHVVAFTRRGDVLVVVPRLPFRLAGPGRFPVGRRVWDGTTVDVGPGGWTDVLSGTEHVGGRLAVGEVLATLPVAVLVPAQGAASGSMATAVATAPVAPTMVSRPPRPRT